MRCKHCKMKVMPVRKGDELLVADYQDNSDNKYDKNIHVLHKCTSKRFPKGIESLIG